MGVFADCPAAAGGDGGRARCGLPAEVEHEYTLSSPDGPVACVKIRCARGHWFSGPADTLAGHAGVVADGQGEFAGFLPPGHGRAV